MDKDLTILKNEQIKTEDAEQGLRELEKSNDDQSKRLADLQKRMDALYKKNGKTKLVEVPKKVASEVETRQQEPTLISYEDLYQESLQLLKERGLDVDSIDFNSFLSDTELADIIEELDKPLPRSDRWTKNDFIVVFIAALVGSVTDFILGDRKNPFTGKGSEFSNKLNEIHETKWKHESGAPIDFQGEDKGISFGGGYHRELSKGHDLLRFVEGIKMFKEGKFEAIGYVDGVAKTVSVAVNQNNTPYEALKLGEAIVEYSHHMLADLFSNNSLPFPGYSFLRECNNRDIRKFSADMYKNGFNLKNVIIQSASTIAIEIIIRLYFSIVSVKKYKDSVEIEEDYSNWEAVKEFISPANKDKLNEMLLVAHTIVTAFNVGKIVITKDVSTINVTEIMSVVSYGIKVLKAVAKRNNKHAVLIYHASEVRDNWEKIGQELGIDESLIEAMDEQLIIA